MLFDLKHTAFAVVIYISAAGLKEGMLPEGGKGSFFLFFFMNTLLLSSKPAVKTFSSDKYFNTISLYKSLLHSLSVSLGLALLFSVGLVVLAKTSFLCDFSLAGPLNAAHASIAITHGSFFFFFMSLAIVQGIILIPQQMEQCISRARLLT